MKILGKSIQNKNLRMIMKEKEKRLLLMKKTKKQKLEEELREENVGNVKDNVCLMPMKRN